MPKRILPYRIVLMTFMLPMVAGCGSPNGRVARLSQESCRRQAQQNETIARQSREVTETTEQFIQANGKARQDVIGLQRDLVQADAKARGELIQIQQDLVERDAEGRKELSTLQKETQTALQAERDRLDQQRENLEEERRKNAKRRHRDPIIAAALTQIGLVLGCLAPLTLCAYLLYVLRHSATDDAAVTELLIDEFVSENPRFPIVPPSVPTLPEEAVPVPGIEHDPGAEADGDRQ